MINFPMLYENRSNSDKIFISSICNEIMTKPLEMEEKEYSEEFAFIYVDGRDRIINKLEDYTSFKSAKVFSKKDYPIFAFINHTDKFLDDNTWLINKWNIKVIKIDSINNLDEYSKFYINKLPFLLPENINNIITIQPDGFLLKEGWENWIKENNIDLIGAHWRHETSLEQIDKNNLRYSLPFTKINKCNLGFSFRKLSKIKEISKKFGHLNFKQKFDENCPEDVFYSYWGFNDKICKEPTLKQCDEFATDPLTLDIWNNKTYGYGFHYFKPISEFPPCNHG